MRPPSRHKDPPLAQGLDLPPDEMAPHVVDIDTDSSSDFEAGIDRANNNNKQMTGEDSFGK